MKLEAFRDFLKVHSKQNKKNKHTLQGLVVQDEVSKY